MVSTGFTVAKQKWYCPCIITEGQIPRGAVYIGEQSKVEDGVKQTDTYYAVPTNEEEEEMSQQSPTSPSEKKPLKYDGIGPMDDKGMPLSFRMVGYCGDIFIHRNMLCCWQYQNHNNTSK